MAVKHFFAGKVIEIPGVYSEIKSGISYPTPNLDYGTVLLIDTGMGAGYGGHSINGALTNGKSSILEFADLDEMKGALMGGPWTDIGDALFNPGPLNVRVNGASKVLYASARTATPASLTIELETKFNLKFESLIEGTVGNADFDDDDILRKGLAFKFTSIVTDSLYAFEIWAGTFAGLDDNGKPWYGNTEANSNPERVVYFEFTSIAELHENLLNDNNLNQRFKVTITSITDTATLTSAELAPFVDLVDSPFAGGTETYNVTDFTDVLDFIQNLSYTFVMTDKNGSNGATDGALNTFNMQLLSHLQNEAKYDKFLFLGGGQDSTEFDNGVDGSCQIAKTYNTEKVVVVHGSAEVNGNPKSSMYKAACVLGRIAGLPPQVPGTFKPIRITHETHELKEKDVKKGLKYGVLMTGYDDEFEGFCIIQAVNSLQNNSNLVNPNGHSYEISVERIGAQLNKLIVINAKRDLLGREDGVNRNTLSPAILESWLKDFLQNQTATETTDNLILYFENITTRVYQDGVYATYKYEPNFPVNKMFFTGVQIDRNLI